MRDRLLKSTSAVLLILVASFLGARCATPESTPLGLGGVNYQGNAPTTSFAGVIDPTNSVWAGAGLTGGMATCTASCSSYAARNGGALKAAWDYAGSSTTPRTISIPPGQYPLPCGVDLGGDSNVTLDAWNVTFRLTGACATDAMIRLRNSTHTRIRGLTISMRDATGTNANTLGIKIGDGGSTDVSDITFTDVAFIEGVGGDFVRLDGGTSDKTVTNIMFTQGCRFEGSARAGVDIRPGVSGVQVLFSFFRNNANRDVWVEDTGDGPVERILIKDDFMERDGSGTAQSISLTGHGGTYFLDQSVIEHVHIKPTPGSSTGGGTIEASGVHNLMIHQSPIATNMSTSAPSVLVTGKASSVTIEDLYVDRGATSSNAAVVKMASDGSDAPTNSIVQGNRVLQYSGIAPGIDVSGCSRCDVLGNNISYFNSTADSGATGFSGVYCSASVNICSGRWERNLIRKESGAGRPLSGLTFLVGAGTTAGFIHVRDNHTDGTKYITYSDANGSAAFPEGYPVVSGNLWATSLVSEFGGAITTWRNETTGDDESPASGALSVSRTTSFLTAVGGVTYTLADGLNDRFEKLIKVKTYTSGTVTIAPTHFADGTLHTLTYTAVNGWARLRWDKTSATYRLVGSSGITLN